MNPASAATGHLHARSDSTPVQLMGRAGLEAVAMLQKRRTKSESPKLPLQAPVYIQQGDTKNLHIFLLDNSISMEMLVVALRLMLPRTKAQILPMILSKKNKLMAEGTHESCLIAFSGSAEVAVGVAPHDSSQIAKIQAWVEEHNREKGSELIIAVAEANKVARDWILRLPPGAKGEVFTHIFTDGDRKSAITTLAEQCKLDFSTPADNASIRRVLYHVSSEQDKGKALAKELQAFYLQIDGTIPLNEVLLERDKILLEPTTFTPDTGTASLLHLLSLIRRVGQFVRPQACSPGLFRVNGAEAEVTKLAALFKWDPKCEIKGPIDAVCCALKRVLSSAQLLPAKLRSTIISEYTSEVSPEAKFTAVWKGLWESGLPSLARDCIKECLQLVRDLLEITGKSPKPVPEVMDLKGFVVVFGPVFFPADTSVSLADLKNAQTVPNEIVALMLSQHERVFQPFRCSASVPMPRNQPPAAPPTTAAV